MVRISKLTDYGMVIMAFMAEMTLMAKAPNQIFQARDISLHTELALPTVSKLLKLLTKYQYLSSSRGTHGGYRLSVSPETITVLDLIQALEGPVAITECNLGKHQCANERSCAIRTPWLKINSVITEALASVTLADLITQKTTATDASMPMRLTVNKSPSTLITPTGSAPYPRISHYLSIDRRPV